jgi:hypothetical protein
MTHADFMSAYLRDLATAQRELSQLHKELLDSKAPLFS